MKSLSNVGLVLSIVFGCLLLALIAELYNLLWWKKRITKSGNDEEDHGGYHQGTGRELLCWTMASSGAQQLCSSDALVHEPSLKPFGDQAASVEAEVRRLQQQNFSGPPRFLFTIAEETREDMESEDDRSRKKSRSRSLSDVLEIIETPFLTPLANSPPYYTPPLTPTHLLSELASDASFNGFVRSSPPPSPKFDFLKKAENKLQARQVFMEKAESGVSSNSSMFIKDEENGSFITLSVAKNREEEEKESINRHRNSRFMHHQNHKI